MMTEILPGMIEAKRRLEPDLLARPGVVGLAVGLAEVDGEVTDTLAIKIYVEPGHAVRGELPGSLEGYPVNVVEHRIVAEGEAMPESEQAALAAGWDIHLYNPLVGGASVVSTRGGMFGGHVGTLGAVVIDRDSGHPMLLSNYHVFAEDKNWTLRTHIAQPCFPPFSSFFEVGNLSNARLTETVDAAVAWQFARGFAWEIEEIGPINGTVKAWLPANAGDPPMRVRKRGITTGLTYGTVTGIDATVKDVEIGGAKYTFKHQIEINTDPDRNPVFLQQGDSGSVVVDESGRVTGLLFALSELTGGRAGWANPINEVTKALGIVIPSSTEKLSTKNRKTLVRTSAGPVLATAAGRPLVLAWSGDGNVISIATLEQGLWWQKIPPIRQNAYNEPAIALAPAGSKNPDGSNRPDYVAWTGTDRGYSLNVARFGEDWSIQDSDKVTLESSYASPALALMEDGTLVLAWTDTDGVIKVATSRDGGKTFPYRVPPDQAPISSNTSGPGLAILGDHLYLLYQGKPPRVDEIPCISEIRLRADGTPSIYYLFFPRQGLRCGGHPSLGLAGQYVLAWRAAGDEKDYNAIVMQVAREVSEHGWGNQVVFDEQTKAAPSLCCWNDTLYIAWTGTDGVINVAELGLPLPSPPV